MRERTHITKTIGVIMAAVTRLIVASLIGPLTTVIINFVGWLMISDMCYLNFSFTKSYLFSFNSINILVDSPV